jgi:PAS domain S-box-containing protein
MTESENKYKTLFNLAPAGLAIIDSDGKITESNRSFKEISRIVADSPVNEFFNRVLIHADGSKMKPDESPWSIAIREKRIVNGTEIGITLNDGSVIWTEVNVTPLEVETGFAIITIRDCTQSKKLLTSLTENEERYKLLFENSGEAILLTNPDGSIYSANPEACRIYNMTEEEICKKGRNGILDLTDPRLEAGIRERREKGRFIGEINQVRKDGTIFPTEITSIIYKDKSGNEKTSTIIRDLTDRKIAESSLIESEARFRSIFENSLLGISIAEEDGRLLQCNSAFARMYGYDNPEIMLREVSNVGVLYAHPEERVEVLKLLKKNGLTAPREFEVIKRDGSYFFVMVSACEVRDAEGSMVYNQAIHMDLTERRKAEEKIREASLYTRELIEASIDPLITINADGIITDVNLSTERITGVNRKKLIGSDFSDYFTEPSKAREVYLKVFVKGLVKDYPLTILHKNGRKTPVLYNATLYKNNAGEIQGVFAAARDITDQKRIEEELQQSKNLLEKLNQNLHDVWEKEKSHIAMNLHDDLGQKFTALSMQLAWIKSRIGVQSKPVVFKLNEMQVEINETIEGLKEISTLLRPSILFDLGLIPAITWHLGKFENQSGIKCNFTCNSEELKLDERTSIILYRIFQESLTNIARHSQATHTTVELKVSQKNICLSIKDNGIGIDNDKINSINSMGIAGIKERTKMARGILSIKGEKDLGTIVKVTIPLTKSDGND